MVWKIWNHSLPFPWIKKKAAEYGYTVAQVYQLVSAKMADSKSATTISTDIKDYKVYVQTQEQTDGQELTVVTSFYPMYIAAENVIGDADGVRLEKFK